jgi:hypothetical protein
MAPLTQPAGPEAEVVQTQWSSGAVTGIAKPIHVLIIEKVVVVNNTIAVITLRDAQNASETFVLYARLPNQTPISGTVALLAPAAPQAGFTSVGPYAALTAAAVFTASFIAAFWGKGEEMREAVRLAKEAYEKAKGLLA